MRYTFIAILTLFLAVLIIKGSLGAYKDKILWDFFPNFTAISNADRKTDEFLKELKDKKEDLDYLQEQINNLRIGLKEMPDPNQNGYFRDLLTKFEDKEYILNQQISQLDQAYREKLRSLSPQEALPRPCLIEQNQENFQEEEQRMHDLMESNQMRAQDQIERLNDLMEQNQMYLEALIERTNNLMERKQNLPQHYMQTNYF